MLPNEVLLDIEKGKINSRRQIYKICGRSKKLLQWLNNNKILIPNRYTKEKLVRELIELKNKLGKLPLANYNNYQYKDIALRFFGTWNNALLEIFGENNQNRYSEFSDEELLNKIRNFVIKNQRIPLRQEFDGTNRERPYFETYFNRFNKNCWSDILSMIDLNGITYFHNNKFGSGRMILHEGVIYLSHGEFLIGKYLKEKQISFEKEVPYNNSNFIFDFYIPEFNLYVEYYGRSDLEDYKKTIEKKREKYANRKVLEIFKHDNIINKLSKEVQRL